MKKSYELQYGWKYVGSDSIFTEETTFSNEEQREKYLFSILNSKYLIILWYKKIDTLT
jgi:hypothetical protein